MRRGEVRELVNALQTLLLMGLPGWRTSKFNYEWDTGKVRECIRENFLINGGARMRKCVGVSHTSSLPGVINGNALHIRRLGGKKNTQTVNNVLVTRVNGWVQYIIEFYTICTWEHLMHYFPLFWTGRICMVKLQSAAYIDETGLSDFIPSYPWPVKTVFG